MNQEKQNFIQRYSPDGGFLQSEEWRMFQETVGRETFHFEGEDFWANIMEHTLPVAGKYWYTPRGPILPDMKRLESGIEGSLQEVIREAKKAGAGWIRIEPSSKKEFEVIQTAAQFSLQKAPHDMQPKEVLVVDISSSEEEILAQMKPKTRYNIRLAEKKGVKVFTSREPKHLETFLDLVETTSRRDGITAHPREYYRKMFQSLPEHMFKLYVAEHEGDILAANLVIIFGEYATYLHGASGNEKRSLMAPYLLQWRQIQDARILGCKQYDFGGVKTRSGEDSAWEGITRFKQGFAPHTSSRMFPGSYDLVLSASRYTRYWWLQRAKRLVKLMRKRKKRSAHAVR